MEREWGAGQAIDVFSSSIVKDFHRDTSSMTPYAGRVMLMTCHMHLTSKQKMSNLKFIIVPFDACVLAEVGSSYRTTFQNWPLLANECSFIHRACQKGNFYWFIAALPRNRSAQLIDFVWFGVCMSAQHFSFSFNVLLLLLLNFFRSRLLIQTGIQCWDTCECHTRTDTADSSVCITKVPGK